MREHRKSSGINIGSATVITVFSVLCLTVFAVLSFITAQSEYSAAVKSAKAVSEYYEAEAAGCKKLAAVLSAGDEKPSVEAALAKEVGTKAETSGTKAEMSGTSAKASGTKPTFLTEKAAEKARELKFSEVLEEKDGLRLLLIQPINEGQRFSMRIFCDKNGSVSVEEWRTEPVGDWNPERNMHFWDGEF